MRIHPDLNAHEIAAAEALARISPLLARVRRDRVDQVIEFVDAIRLEGADLRRVAAYFLTNDCRHPAGGRPSTALPKSRSTRLEGGPPGAPEIRSHFYPVEPVSTTTGAWAKIADALKDWPFWLCVALALSLTALVLTPWFYTLLRPTAGTAVQFAAVVAWIVAVCGAAAPIAAAFRAYRAKAEARTKFVVTPIEQLCVWGVLPIKLKQVAQP